MNYSIERNMEKSFSARKVAGFLVAIPVIAGVFYLLLMSIVSLGEYLHQYIDVFGYIVAIGVVALAVNLICKLIVKPTRKALFPHLDAD